MGTQLGFNYLQLFGAVADSDWPYVSGSTGDGGDCDYDLSKMTPVVRLGGYNSLTPNTSPRSDLSPSLLTPQTGAATGAESLMAAASRRTFPSTTGFSWSAMGQSSARWEPSTTGW